MADAFEDHQSGLTSPAETAQAIIPSDSVELEHVTRAVYVGGAGDLRVIMRSGEEASFKAVQAGMVYPLRVAQVLATGTTATSLVGLR